jgi:tetratricopeptide (TPR) repeat protein
MSHKKLKETQLVAPKTDLLMDPVSYSIQNEQSGNIPFSIEEEQEPAKLERMDSLDLQVQNVVQQYELMKIQQEEKNRPRQRRRSSILMEQHRLKELVERTNEPDDSDYITEEESVEEDKSVKPLPSEGKRLWQIIRKDIQKKKLINSLKGSVELEHDLLVKQRRELESVLEKDEEENVGVSEVQIFVPKDGKPDPRAFYQMQRRQYDMEKFPDLYANIKINPVTNQLELSITKKPTIGISPEPDRAKMLADDDPDVVHQFYIRHGLQINGFTTSGQRNLYEIVHNIDRRKAGLSGMDRVKYPTFDDPGPPLDATGTPRLDDSMMEEEKQPDLSQEIQKLDVLINESTAPVPAYYRKRGILLARTGKYNRAMEDLDNAIQYDQFNSDGLWHRHQLYLRYNDGSSALADLDSLTENNKVHLGAFQAKARIYQALGMYKLATVNYGTVIRLKPDNPDAYFNRALLFEVDDEITFANEDYRAVRLLDPTNEVAIHNLAMYSFQKQLWSDCISEYSKLILFNPESADYYMFRGRAYASMSFYVEALEDLTQAIRINPDKSMYYFHRGCLLREQNIPKAIQDLSTSILLDDSIQNSDSYYYRGITYLHSTTISKHKAKRFGHLGLSCCNCT